MKKLHLNHIRNTLSISRNRKGLSLDNLYKFHPYQIPFDIFNLLIHNDNYIEIDDNKLVKLKDLYYTTTSFQNYEEKRYNLNYLKTLFLEENNMIKFNIYKILVDSPQLTYQQISNEMDRLYQVKLDIKQVSHYCMELMKIKLITSTQCNTGEKVNQLNKVSLVYLEEYDKQLREKRKKGQSFFNENLINDHFYCRNNLKNNIHFDLSLCHYPENILNINQNEILSENKFFLSNRFSFIVDKNEIKNNIFFHLLINKEKGLTSNEICFLCDFIGRDKTLSKIIKGLKDKKEIVYKTLREGKKLEFVYFISNTAKVDPKILALADFYLNNHTHSKNIKDEDLNRVLVSSSVNNFEELNEIDYDNLKFLLSKEHIKLEESNTQEAKRKNISKYITLIEKTKNLSNSAYNRYVFVLNQIREYGYLTLNEIKQLILSILEEKKDFIIDRKTLKRILLNLEKMKLIKLQKFQLTMKNLHQSYQNEKEEIKQEKIVAMRLDIDENNKEMLDKLIEKMKPPKKSITKEKINNCNDGNKKDDKEEVKQKINEVINKSNKDIKVTQKDKNVSILIGKLEKVFNKYEPNKKSKLNFINQLKRNYTIDLHTEFLFEKKEININNNNNHSDGPSIEKLYSYIESSVPSNIIIPKYIMKKMTESTGINCFNDNEIKNANVFEYYSSNYIRKVLNNMNIEKEYNTISNGDFIGKKRNFNEGFTPINKAKFDFKKWNKLIDIYALIKEIYFMPGITFHMLKKKIHLSNEYDGAESEIIQYLQKMKIINILNINNESNILNDSSSIYIDPNFKMFIEI